MAQIHGWTEAHGPFLGHAWVFTHYPVYQQGDNCSIQLEI